jgi:DNA-binding SARP family transcriptional activator
LAAASSVRIQLCGRLAVEIGGRRVEKALPGRQGRLVFVYLAAHRTRSVARDELAEALWPGGPPAGADSALSALLSKLRRTLGEGTLEGRSEVRLVLPPDAWVDLEAAAEAIHAAESAVALGDWKARLGAGANRPRRRQARLPARRGRFLDPRAATLAR